MKKTLCLILGCFLVVIGLRGHILAAGDTPEELRNLYARSAVLLDGSSGRILFGKNEGEALPMASTTKIMTCILALENCELDEKVSVSAKAAAQPEVHLGVQAGEEYYLGDILYSLMLESHNDSAVIVAEHVGGSVEEFAQMMNKKAAELGCMATHFVTPNGLDARDEEGVHSTTAAELARIMRYCITQSPQREAFLKITQTRSHSFTDLSGARNFSCQNHNTFLDMMKGAISGKTGFTSDAGYCYVGALESEGRLFIVALLACGWPYNRNYKWDDTKKLMEYGMENYVNRVIQCTEKPDPIPVEGGIAADLDPWKQVTVQAAPDLSGHTQKAYLIGKNEQIKSRVRVKKSLAAPVEKGLVVGTVGYYLGDELLEEYPIVTQESVGARQLEHWFWWAMGRYAL